MFVPVTCVNHPERAGVERCEVCNDALCAYCLYYTSDGQRLCKKHAEAAAASGAFIRAPGVYAEGLVGAQVGANNDQPLLEHINTPYRGNMTDVMALIGLLLGVVSISTCLILPICLFAPFGLIFSVLALFGAKDAHDKARTRLFAGFGLALSVLWLLGAFSCGSLYNQAIQSAISSNGGVIRVLGPGQVPPIVLTSAPPLIFSDTSTPVPTDTPTLDRGR